MAAARGRVLMADLTIIVDEQVPPHALWITMDGSDLRVTVSPRVEAPVLTSLEPSIASAIVTAIENSRRAKPAARSSTC